MNEEDIRGLVREAIERHLNTTGTRPFVPPRAARTAGVAEQGNVPHTSHCSHTLLNIVRGNDMDDGMCLIEPAVRCNHCGFCQSYGH